MKIHWLLRSRRGKIFTGLCVYVCMVGRWVGKEKEGGWTAFIYVVMLGRRELDGWMDGEVVEGGGFWGDGDGIEVLFAVVYLFVGWLVKNE